MLFDELLKRLHERIVDYQGSGQESLLVSDVVVAEAKALENAIPAGDVTKRSAAHYVLGWVYFLRHTVLPSGQNERDLARSLVYFSTVAGDHDAVPGSLRTVVGPSAVVDAQADLAADFLRHAMTETDTVLLDAAVLLLTAAVAAAPSGSPDRADYLSNLSVAYHERYRCGAVPDDLDRAVEAGAGAVAASSERHQNLGGHLSNLGVALCARYRYRRAAGDLDRAIEVEQKALALTPSGHPDHARYLSSLGTAYRLRSERTGSVADAERAVQHTKHAVDATDHAPDRHDPERAMFLSHLANAYHERYLRGGAPADLDLAIDAGMRALASGGRCELSTLLSNLGIAYQDRFEIGGRLADLDRAIEIGEQAIGSAPDNDPALARYLSNVGSACQKRYERGGVPADLDRAVELGRRAVDAVREDHPNRALFLSNLCGAYQQKYERSGAMTDLDQAVELGEQAVAAVLDDDPKHAMYLSNLGLACWRRYQRDAVRADLDRAIQVGEQAVAATRADDPVLVAMRVNLGNAYLERFEHSNAPTDLDLAVEVAEKVIAAADDHHPDRATHLSNLGNIYGKRYEHGRSDADLSRAVEVSERAVAVTSHPRRAIHLSNLATLLLKRYDLAGTPVSAESLRDLVDGVDDVQEAGTATPTALIRAGHRVGSLAHAMRDLATAVALLDDAVALLPSAVPRDAERGDQEHRLGEHWGLIGEAVAAHCAAGDPAGAVEAAEWGRGILLAATLDAQADLTELHHADPKLAAGFRDARDRLNQQSVLDREPATRKGLWEEYDKLLDRIRHLPRFERFLLPPRLADLRSAASGGAVVLVNAGRYRSDAVIVTAEDEPLHVELRTLTWADVESYTEKLLGATYDDQETNATELELPVVPEILEWLWISAVQPILDALPPSVPRRVWWLPTGVLGLFPLHAAGAPGRPGALDAVVSSYTPTLRALAHSRTRPPAATRRLLAVAVQDTPGLPGVAGEVADLVADLTLVDHDATTGRVLTALRDATWVHLACHAGIDLFTPSRGGFRLHDGTLPIADLSRLRLRHAELAYLSACSTGHRGIRHADESIHLASAFQSAGFRHVIAGLWPLNDRIAVTAARAFYRTMPDGPDAGRAAAVLRDVTIALRSRYPEHPTAWAALIHSGQ